MYGTDELRGIQMAADDLNSVGTPEVKLNVEDDRSDPAQAVSAYLKLKSQGANAIIGSTFDFTTNAILPLSGRDKFVVFTSVLPESIDLKASDGYAFTNGRSAANAVLPFEKYAKREGVKRLVLLATNNAWGQVQLRAYKAKAADLHLQVLSSIETLLPDENDWQSVVVRIKKSEPDAVLLLLNQKDIELFLRRSKELDLKSKLFAAETAAETLRATGNPERLENLCLSYPLGDLPHQQDFARRFRKKYGEDPRSTAPLAYDSLKILHQAFEQSIKTGISLREAILSTKYDGIGGRQVYEQNKSFSVGGFSLVCIRNGLLHPE